jgi:hypothetical protein
MFRATLEGWSRAFASALVLTLVLAPVTAFADRGGTTEILGDRSRPTDASNQTVRIHIQNGEHCLRAASAGVRTRNSGSPTTGGVITLPASVPAGSILWAGLYWTILANTPPPNAVTLNGVAVIPVLLPVTPSPCWLETYAFAYFADVSTIAVAGANVVAGLDDSGALNVGPESEGASLVVIYKSDNSNACEIIVTDGNDLTQFLGQTIDHPLPVTCPPDLPALLTFIGGDGQGPAYGFADDQRWNGVALGDGDDFDASDPATAGTPVDLAWDTDTHGVISNPPFIASLTIPAAPPAPFVNGDCINWVATVLEVGVKEDPNCHPVPATKATWGRMKNIYR